MSEDDRRINKHALEVVGEILSDYEVFRSSHLYPDTGNPERLRIELDESRFKSAQEVFLEVRWYTDGDYNFHYQENRGGEKYRCRWDKHPEYRERALPREVDPGESFRHFHRPPDATYEPRVRGWRDDHVRDLIDHIRVWIDDRMEELWEDR